MTYEPLHHKYRPQTFAQLVGQEAIAATLSNAMLEERIAPAYLLTGPRGTGKTSSARILAKSLNCLRDGRPTPTPCGECEVCREIARGAAMDIVEIDAASNTGVDNIREIIERAQFAPVRCRYKVYVIDECLTGDARILTREGSMRLDNPELEGKEVLSYNEEAQRWEFKRVRRWMERGEREIFVVKTRGRELRCTGNHLIRTATGWQEVRSLQPGMQILSPAPGLARGYFLQRLVEFARLTGYRLLHLRDRPTYSAIDERVRTDKPYWQTLLEPLEDIAPAGIAPVYDLEVEDNHNFVANGLLVHNCHMLSTAAFNALLKTLEEPPARVIFVLATTDPQRVLNTIISRCQRFDFRRIPLKAMVEHLTLIADKEAIAIEPDAIAIVAQLSNGGLRDAESTLDQLSLLAGTVTVERVWELVGAISERDLLELLRAIALDNPVTVLDCCRHLMDRGREPLVILQSLAGFYLNLLIARTSPQRSDLISVTSATWEQLCQEAQQWEMTTILHGQQHLKTSEVQIKNSTQPRLWLEVTVLGLLPSALAPAVTSAPKTLNVPAAQNVQKAASQPANEPIARSNPGNEKIAVQNTSVMAKATSHHPTEIEATNHYILSETKANEREINPPKSPVLEGIANNSNEITTSLTTAPTNNDRDKVVSQNVPVATAPTNNDRDKSAPADSEKSVLAQHQARVQKFWERVIAALPGILRGNVRRSCQLIDLDFDDSVAYIAVVNQNQFGMAESKRSNIEAAFEEVFQEKFKVNLQVGNATPSLRTVQPAPPRAAPPTIVTAPQPQAKAKPALESPPATPAAAPPRERAEPTVAARQPAIEAPPPERSKINEGAVSSPSPAVEEELLGSEETDEGDGEVMQAALELARLLEGEIIRDKALGNSVTGPVAIAPLPETELESLPLAEEEQEEEEDDIPF